MAGTRQPDVLRLLAARSTCRAPIELKAVWRDIGSGYKFERFDSFKLRNAGDKPLSNAVVEIIAENNWGEKAQHYLFFKEWPAGVFQRAIPHPRWEKRVLPYVTDL